MCNNSCSSIQLDFIYFFNSYSEFTANIINFVKFILLVVQLLGEEPYFYFTWFVRFCFKLINCLNTILRLNLRWMQTWIKKKRCDHSLDFNHSKIITERIIYTKKNLYNKELTHENTVITFNHHRHFLEVSYGRFFFVLLLYCIPL